MLKDFLVILLFFILINLNAQENLHPGYILKSENDTVFGYIDDKNYYLISLYCDFKTGGYDSLIRYFPKDLYGYRIQDDKYYITKEVKIDGKDSLVFLEYLIHGKIDFFMMQDKGRINHFYATDGSSPLVELLYKDEIIRKDGKNYLKENKQYISVLEFLTRSAPEMAKDIEYFPDPKQKNLIKLGEEYHNLVCKDWDCVVYNKKMKFNYVMELAGGAKLFSKNFENEFRSLLCPIVGIKFYFSNPRFSERAYFGTGIFYEGQSVVDSSGVSFRNYKIPITYSYISPKKGFSPTVSAGLNIRNYQGLAFTSVSLIPGMRVNFKTLCLNFYIDLEFGSIFVIPVGYHSTNFGISLYFKLN